MSSQRWLKIREVFESACDLSPDCRQAFLSEACEDDPRLREEVESILAASEQSPAFFEVSAAEAFPELFDREPAAALVGERIGAYELVSFIASGGMGAVYLGARADDQYDKQVAIKLIKRRLVTQQTIRRFRGERQMLAALDHPNIARLLDGGVTREGLPYLVMEHVDGLPIDRFCDERALSTAQRLRLFRQVCAAVTYAHQNLVVHRDLKPSNILVTSDGTPKLLDFGIAKVVDPQRTPDGAAPTVIAHRVMTPEYASPEQIRGEAITTATDVYSLGVILFELLTGHHPYRLKGRMPHEIERTICEEDPQRPSTAVSRAAQTSTGDGTSRTLTQASRTRNGQREKLRRRLAGDLDEIVLMALRKEPEHRYATVEQFSRDIQRHLDGLPVIARKGTLRYRAAKFVRRNKPAVLAAGAIAVTLMAATTFAVAAQRRTQTEAIKVEQVNAFLNEMLAAVDVNTPGSPVTVRAILDQATERIEAGGLAGQSDVEAELRMTIGMAYLELGMLDAADAHLSRALDMRRQRVGERHLDVAESLNALGRLAKTEGDDEEAERLYRQALELRRERSGDRSAETAETMNNLAVLLKSSGRLEEAEALLRIAVEVRQSILSEMEDAAVPNGPQLKRSRVDVATSLTNLAAVLKNKGAYEEAQPLYRESLQAFRAALGPRHYRVAVCMNNLALLLTEVGRYDEAEPLYRDALEIRREVFGDEHLAVATGLKNLALLLTTAGRYEEAEPLYREALALGRKLPGNEQRLANTLNNFADLLATLGRYDKAEALCREALEIRRSRSPDHPRVAGSLMVLGRILVGKGDPAAAEPLLREAVARYRETLSQGHVRIARARSELGGCLVALGDYDEAEQLLLESFAAVSGGEHGTMKNQALERLVDLYEAWGKPEAATTYLEMRERGP